MQCTRVCSAVQPRLQCSAADSSVQCSRLCFAVKQGTRRGTPEQETESASGKKKLHSDGTPYAGASTVDGATIDRLTHRKRVTEYPDLATSPQIEYLVLACEEGGRWGPDQHRLLRSLVRTKVASIHPLLRRRASLAYTRRWWGILSIGAQTVAADCILGRESPVPAPTSALPLASVLPLIDIGTEPSRMR